MNDINDIKAAIAAKHDRVAIHFNVDLDACASAALWGILVGKAEVAELDIEFVSAGVKPEDMPAGCVALDVTAGLKGAETSCFQALLENYASEASAAALALFARHVTLQDQGKLFDESFCPKEIQIGSLGAILGMLRMQYLAEGKPLANVDRLLLVFVDRLVRQHLAAGLERIEAEKVVREQGKVYADGRIIVLPQGAPQGATGVAYDFGAKFVVYQDGLNVGLVRSSGCTSPNLNEALAGRVPEGFYLDPRGFMASWGSRKAPATKPCPLTAEQLAELLETQLPEQTPG